MAWQQHTTLWGALLNQPNNRAATPLRFPGQYHDPETGLHYNYHRYYDPLTARYTTADPLGQEPNPSNHHAYAPNPLAWLDPLGLMSCRATAGDEEDTVSLFKASQRGLGESHYTSGYKPEDFPGNGAYFARQREISESYAVHYGEGVIETRIPRSVYDENFAQYEMVYLGTPPGAEFAIPPGKLELLNRFERIWHR